MLFDPGRVGKDFICNDENESLAESVVLKLLSTVDNKKKRNVFCDSWYSSISLMKKLTKMGFYNTTVLRANSKDLPQKIKLEGYDKAYNDQILIQKYEGKKTIYFATNYKIDKEELRNIYNIKNRGVDTFDQYLEMSSIQRRTKKLYKKIFLFGIDASIINSKIIFELKGGKPQTTIKFKEKLADQIFRLYNNKYAKNIKIDMPFKMNIHLHNVGHVMNNIKVCKNCNRKTIYICLECNIHLHPECFTLYHKKFIYK